MTASSNPESKIHQGRKSESRWMDADGNELEIVVHAWKKDDINPDKSYSVLYILNLETGEAKCSGDKLFRKGGMGEMVALGDVIYIIGSSRVHEDEDEDEDDVRTEKEDPCKAVSCIDLSEICGCWKRIPNFRSLHDTPNCIAFKGKIYLFCGHILDRDDKLLTLTPGEVYDPQRGCWDDLPLPAPDDAPDAKDSWANYVSIPPILDHANDRLLVHFKHVNFLYAYYPHQLKWQPLFPMQSFVWAPLCVVVDDIILFSDPETDDHFRACDLRDGKWRSVSVSVEVPDFDYNLLWWDFDALIPLNPAAGTFCLVVQYPLDTLATHLTFLKLRVEVSSSRHLLITFYSIINLDIPGLYSIYNYLPILGRKTRLGAETLEKLTHLGH